MRINTSDWHIRYEWHTYGVRSPVDATARLGDEDIASITTDAESTCIEDEQALSDVLLDEYAARDERSGEMFEIVAVPDDVTSQHDKARDDGICLDCCLDRGAAGDNCDEFDAYEEPRRVTGRATPDVRR